jgi:hypothetical protein
MSKKITLIGLVLLFAFTAAAQNTTPQMEAFLGYTFTRMNSATNVPAFSANGGSGQFVYDFNKWISAVADLGAVHNGNIHNIHLDTTMANFLVGPRLPFRHWSRVTPYFQILFGEVYASTSAAVPADRVLLARYQVGDWLWHDSRRRGGHQDREACELPADPVGVFPDAA